MSQILIALSTWLHAIATVLLIGHYLLLSLVYLPAASKGQSEAEKMFLSEISKRIRFWMYTSLAIFIITGTYLTFADSNYLGIGDFGNLWAILMLVKHILILVMLGLGFWFNAILRVGPLLSSNSGSAQALSRFWQYSNLMAICGVLVLLLTAIAQVE